MATDAPVKALLMAFSQDAPAAIYTLNRLKPEQLCFFLAEPSKQTVETAIQPHVAQMPRRWDWVVTPNPHSFADSYRPLAQTFPDLLRTWEVGPGELVLDLTGATPAMAASMMLVGSGTASRMVGLAPAAGDPSSKAETVDLEGQARLWLQSNPWDDMAAAARRDGGDLFNSGAYEAAASLFRMIEVRVSGGQKPLYHALAGLADGYGFWERFQYRQAWEKLKGAYKALEMASVWGGPPSLKTVLPAIKANMGFLEKLVLDPNEVKELLALDLLAHVRRRAEMDRDAERALVTLIRALEAFAQYQLFKQHQIKSWDVSVDALPQALQETCRTCHLSDLDGKYKLPLHEQFRALAGLGHPMGQTFLAQWAKMKPLLDAAHQAVLGHGFEPVKAERVHQLYEIVVKVTGVSDTSLPRFPVLNL
ncbi:MAG: TIGR02710 family CRISPR-associated protein [Nitrospira sp.]|nr:MAG: TIGR02710 family CRISPR-associated protein [Nitrospira sp.]